MKKNLVSRVILAALCGALLVPVSTGCGSRETELSKEEEKNFKGGPMPPEARAAMQRGGAPGGAPPGPGAGGGR